MNRITSVAALLALSAPLSVALPAPQATAANRAQFIAGFDTIFTPAVVAAIRANKIRAFRPGSDDGEAPGPLMKGEYLLDAPEILDQLVFSPQGGSYVLNRIPFYS